MNESKKFCRQEWLEFGQIELGVQELEDRTLTRVLQCCEERLISKAGTIGRGGQRNARVLLWGGSELGLM